MRAGCRGPAWRTFLAPLSGIGTIASASWAARLQEVLLWIAFAYFVGSGVLIAGYLVLALAPDRSWPGWLLAAMVFGTGLPYCLWQESDATHEEGPSPLGDQIRR